MLAHVPPDTHVASCSLPKAAVPIRTVVGVHVIPDVRLQADSFCHQLREHLILLGSVLLQVPRFLALIKCHVQCLIHGETCELQQDSCKCSDSPVTEGFFFWNSHDGGNLRSGLLDTELRVLADQFVTAVVAIVNIHQVCGMHVDKRVRAGFELHEEVFVQFCNDLHGHSHSGANTIVFQLNPLSQGQLPDEL